MTASAEGVSLASVVSSSLAAAPKASSSFAVAIEAGITAWLMFVIASVALATPGHLGRAALAIGATVGLAALVAGPLTGASMNPARSVGPALVSGELSGLWIYLIAPCLGALVAVVGCRWIHGEACCAGPGGPRA